MDIQKGLLRNIWYKMIDRCHKVSSKHFMNYGERGIYVCEEWRLSRQSFIRWAIENGHEKGLQLDRVDNDKGYSPLNCRFTTRLINNRNKRNHITVTAFGETKLAVEWCEDNRCSVTYRTLVKRIRNNNLSSELMITKPSAFKNSRANL
jgi:hypothetical protein